MADNTEQLAQHPFPVCFPCPGDWKAKDWASWTPLQLLFHLWHSGIPVQAHLCRLGSPKWLTVIWKLSCQTQSWRHMVFLQELSRSSRGSAVSFPTLCQRAAAILCSTSAQTLLGCCWAFLLVALLLHVRSKLTCLICPKILCVQILYANQYLLLFRLVGMNSTVRLRIVTKSYTGPHSHSWDLSVGWYSMWQHKVLPGRWKEPWLSEGQCISAPDTLHIPNKSKAGHLPEVSRPRPRRLDSALRSKSIHLAQSHPIPPLINVFITWRRLMFRQTKRNPKLWPGKRAQIRYLDWGLFSWRRCLKCWFDANKRTALREKDSVFHVLRVSITHCIECWE